MSFTPSLISRWLTLVFITAAAFWLRTHDLARRPMHADEANQAVKLGELLEAGRYAFDPRDHHGPTLYYAAVPIAWLRGERTLAALSETTVRLVPALFGTASVLLLALLVAPWFRSSARDGSGWPALAAAAFLAVSPPAVYYSRYFIQETLLVTFTLATFVCAQSWWRTRHTGWAIATGVSMGLMQATKATAPLFLTAAALAIYLAYRLSRRNERQPADGNQEHRQANRTPPSPHLLPRALTLTFTLSAFLLTAALLYSSFGTNLTGLRDALSAYAHAATRFGSDAPPTGHEKPWWYFVHLFGWFRNGGLVWHQIAFSALALAGFVLAFIPGAAAASGRTPLLRVTALYTAFIILAFSLLAYKTPWHAIHFVPGLAVLAAATLATVSRLNTGRPLAVAFALVTLATQYQQTQRVAFLRPADQRNPYAYVHSSPDILKYRALAEAAIARAPDQPIRVIGEEYWPLPWYFRGLPQVGYYATPPADSDGAFIVSSTDQAEAVRARLTRTYRESFLGLRPGVVCILFTLEP